MKGRTHKFVKSTFLLIILMLSATVMVGFGGGLVRAATVTTFSQTYGGPNDEQANAVIQTSDGGYALAGWTDSYGNGNINFWLVKTISSGSQNWTQAYGNSGDNEANASSSDK